MASDKKPPGGRSPACGTIAGPKGETMSDELDYGQRAIEGEIHPLNERADSYNRIEDFGFKAGDRLRVPGAPRAMGTIVVTRYGLKLFYDGAVEPASGTRWNAFEVVPR